MESIDSRNCTDRGSASSSQLADGGEHPVLGADKVPKSRSKSSRSTVGYSTDGGRLRDPDPDVRLVEDLTDTLERKARAKSVSPPYDPEVEEACPLLWNLITKSTNKDGTDRYLPEMTLIRVEGGYECTLRDVETNQMTVFAFERLADLARAAETHFASGKAVWKTYKNKRNPKGIDRHEKKKS